MRILIFFLVFILGVFIGVMLMCMLHIYRYGNEQLDNFNETIEDLTQKPTKELFTYDCLDDQEGE